MPSPFPGMDPYLEDPTIWPGFHHELASQIRHALAPKLRPSYFAGAERRIYILADDDPALALVPEMIGSAEKGRRPPSRTSLSGIAWITRGSLDLADLVRRMYDELSYDLELDDSKPPVPPLGPEDEAWARERIAARPG